MSRPKFDGRLSRGLAVLLALSVATLGGCVIDGDALATATAEAALNSISSSIVESLSTYLEGT